MYSDRVKVSGRANVIDKRTMKLKMTPAQVLNPQHEGHWFVDEAGDLLQVVQCGHAKYQLIAIEWGNRVLDNYDGNTKKLTPVTVEITIKD